jgi:putative CocE/NonD family hydrolase
MPILTITGYFDSDQPGALRYYREHMENSSKKAKENHYLLMGPWDHPGTRNPKREIGGLSFGDNSVLDMDQLQIDWFNWVLRGGEKPSILKDRINYYVMGKNIWNHVSKLSQISTKTKRMYLSSVNNSAKDIFHSGRLSEKLPAKQEPDFYRYNPLDNLALNSIEASYEYGYFLDQSAASMSNILVYHSAPFRQKITISGVIEFVADISMDVADTDIEVKLYVIMPDGMSYYLGDDKIRARHRSGVNKSEIVIPGMVEQYLFDGFYLTSRELPVGSRLRLVVSPKDSKNWQRNYNAAKAVSEQTKEDAEIATVKIHLAEGRTYLKLPVLESYNK